VVLRRSAHFSQTTVLRQADAATQYAPSRTNPRAFVARVGQTLRTSVPLIHKSCG